MPHYIVTWTTDMIADSPREAAEKALEIHRNPLSLATVFTVEDTRTGSVEEVDVKYMPDPLPFS